MRISDWSSDVCSSDLTVPSNPRAVFSDLDQVNVAEDYGVSLRSQAELPFADLSSLTAYRRGSMTNIFDLDGTAQLGGRTSREDNYAAFVKELQSGRSSRSSDGMVGLYYFHRNK